MVVRLFRCLKAWGTGILIMGFPIVFFYYRFNVGTEIWRIPVAVFLVYFPFLLLFEFFLLRYLKHSKWWRILVLIFLFILSEIEFYYLPHSFTQLTFHPDKLSVAILLLFTFFAAFIISEIMPPKTNLVIIQKEL